MKDGLPQVIDIWLEKVRRGWKIEDAPNEAIRKELRKRLKSKKEINNNDNYAKSNTCKSESLS